MISVNFYLDKRRSDKLDFSMLKLSICKKSSIAYLSLNVKLHSSQWDAQKGKIINHTGALALQSYIEGQKRTVQNIILQLLNNDELTNLNAHQIKNKVLDYLKPEEASTTFFSWFIKYRDSREADSTKEKYAITAKRILEFDPRARTLSFEDINKTWLQDFDQFLIKTKLAKNSRNIHFRNIRAVFNDAIDNGITVNYPFRKFPIRPEPTIKRSLTVKQLRELFSYKVEPYQERYLDMFKLSFFLIGINVRDLCLAADITPDGRLVYKRAKTKQMFSIKVEPEAMEIINKYRGKQYLLNLMDNIKKPKTFTLKFDRGLQQIGPTTYEPNPEWKPGSKKHKFKVKHISAFPGLSSYWARHTWASIASELDIPEDVISRSLGHSGLTGARVTDVYINFNNKKIDEANRKVIDYVLYDKRD